MKKASIKFNQVYCINKHCIKKEYCYNVIIISDYHQLAFYSGFYDIDDMIADHKEYEPAIIDNDLYIGDIIAD